MFPWHALSLFALQLGLRSYQILCLAQQKALPPQVWSQWPWLLWSDLTAAIFVGLIWDWWEPAWTTRFPAASRTRARIFGIFFTCLVGYLGFSFQFYSYFNDFFNYGFWTQIDRLSSYWKTLGQEISWGTLAGTAACLAYAWSTRAAARHRPSRGKSTQAVRATGLVLVLVWSLGFSPWGHALPPANWQALDKNPLIELLSFITPEPAARAARRINPDTAKLPHLSFVRRLPPTERQNMSVLLLILESTTPEYAGLTRAVPAGLTPNLTRLGAASLMFTNHYCQEPATLKSWYSLLTGRYSYATRRWRDFILRAKPDLSLPEILKTHGYRSLFLTSSNGRTYSQNEFLQGRFDEVLDRQRLKKRYPGWREYSDCLDDRVLPGALDDFLQHTAEKKFFAVVSPYFPHHPYDLPDPAFQVNAGNTDFARYQSSLHFADALVGQLTEVLAKNGRAENTLLVIVSDHGEAFRQHPGNTLHSVYLYEENVRTLFLLHNPRLLQPGRLSSLTRHIDVLPTILDLLGYASPGCDGESVVTLSPPRTAFFYTTFSDPRYGLRSGAWKYLLNRRSGAEELDNMETDPNETRNRA
ncbi:MAG: sulfatase-like hydrolase/transferase, partial [Candidatus Firestonebacteria bacterium]|nr:sulfatase-like hydrolase/transferase [Candidatus Firestonebacteria bacterium]